MNRAVARTTIGRSPVSSFTSFTDNLLLPIFMHTNIYTRVDKRMCTCTHISLRFCERLVHNANNDPMSLSDADSNSYSCS